MGIDGIGKPPGSPPGVGSPSGVPAAGGTGATFQVEQAGKASSASVSPELERLGRGEITLDAYLEARVNEATLHLQGKISPEQLSFVQQTLRSQLETDPVLIELVRKATGKTVGG